MFLSFDSVVRLHLCANGDTTLLEKGSRLFARVLGAGNVAIKTGFWNQYQEPDYILEFWFNSDDTSALRKVERAFFLLEVWQRKANQEAVSVELEVPGRSVRVVVFNDWQGTWESAVLPVLEPGLQLAEWFDIQAARHGEG